MGVRCLTLFKPINLISPSIIQSIICHLCCDQVLRGMSCVPGFPHSQSPLSLWGLSGCPQLSQLTVTETVSVRGEKWTGQRGCTSAGAALKILFIFILWPFYLFIFLTCCSDKTLWQLGLLEPMKYILTYCSTSQWVKSNRWSHDNNIPFWVKSPNSLHSFKNHSRFGFNLFYT